MPAVVGKSNLQCISAQTRREHFQQYTSKGKYIVFGGSSVHITFWIFFVFCFFIIFNLRYVRAVYIATSCAIVVHVRENWILSIKRRIFRYYYKISSIALIEIQTTAIHNINQRDNHWNSLWYFVHFSFDFIKLYRFWSVYDLSTCVFIELNYKRYINKIQHNVHLSIVTSIIRTRNIVLCTNCIGLG